MSAGTRRWTGPVGATALEAVSLGVGFLTQTLLMRRLGVSGYGECVLAVAVALGIATLTDFGFNLAGTRQTVLWADEPLKRARLYWAVLAAKFAVGSVALGALASWPASEDVLPAAVVAALGAALFPSWYLTGRNRLIANAAALLAGRTAVLLGAAAAVSGPEDAVLASMVVCAAPVVALLFLWPDREWRAVLRPVVPSTAEVAGALRLGMGSVGVSAAPAAGSAVVLALIAQFGSSATAGSYAAADKVRAGIHGLLSALAQAMFPRSVADHRQGARPGRATLHLLSLACFAALPVAAFAPAIVGLVAGPGYEDASSVLRVMSVALVTSTGVTAMGLFGLLADGRFGRYLLAVCSGLVAQVALLALLVPAAGATGAAWAMLLADLATLAIVWRTLRADGNG